MPFTAADIMRRASTILQDADAVRWVAPELLDWLNEGIRAIVTIKPDAATESRVIELAEGTRQAIPDDATILSRVLCNVDPMGARGRSVRVLSRLEILNAQIPGWHSSDTLPFTAVVDMVFQDPMNQREFYVVPGNDGTGSVEAIVGVMPDPVDPPANNQTSIDSYTGAVPLPDQYQPILLDFLLFRAFSKDSAAPDAANRAQAHLSLANQGLQAMNAGQTAMSLAYAYSVAPGAATA